MYNPPGLVVCQFVCGMAILAVFLLLPVASCLFYALFASPQRIFLNYSAFDVLSCENLGKRVENSAGKPAGLRIKMV
ncbi:MAG: hypothetical protein A2Y07_01025 [Planctomycetes bacterium GWF2_50_10]|nr:MAG: hypothetical protein A2Y07_01025 [Planctomycetes bacterium GWF2_50_10]